MAEELERLRASLADRYQIDSELGAGGTEGNQARAQRDRSLGIEKSYTSFIFPHDLAGTPALALPCGFSGNGLPDPMQLAGDLLSEAMLCRIGHAYDEGTEWHGRHPPIR